MRPVVSNLTERIYELLEPLHADDEAYGYAMLILSSAAAAMMEAAYGWSNGEDGSEPWQHLVDTAELEPGKPNEFLAQMLGLPIRSVEPSLVLLLMAQGLAFGSGTAEYLRVALVHLTGQPNIQILERSDENLAPDPYGIVVRSNGIIDPDALDFLNQWKPAGFKLHVVDFYTYFDVAAGTETYAEEQALYTDYGDMDWPG